MEEKLTPSGKDRQLFALTHKIFSWPSVIALFLVVVGIGYLEVSETNYAYLICGASVWAQSTTFIIMALVARSNAVLLVGKTAAYRFWLACCCLETIVIWLLLRAFAPPHWKLGHEVFFVFPGGLLLAWLISLIPRSSSSANSSQQ